MASAARFQAQVIVILPDQLHCIWTLPAENADFSTRWHDFKAKFAAHIQQGRDFQADAGGKASGASGSGGFGNTLSATRMIMSAMWIIFTIIR